MNNMWYRVEVPFLASYRTAYRQGVRDIILECIDHHGIKIMEHMIVYQYSSLTQATCWLRKDLWHEFIFL